MKKNQFDLGVHPTERTTSPGLPQLRDRCINYVMKVDYNVLQSIHKVVQNSDLKSSCNKHQGARLISEELERLFLKKGLTIDSIQMHHRVTLKKILSNNFL